MKASFFWLPLLTSFLLACASSSGESSTASPAVASKALPGNHVDEEKVHWPYPEQERWVEEPVFGGQLHLVEAGRQNHKTIVLIHGLGYRGILDWVQVIPELTDRYHVIAIDLPGFGSSDKHQEQLAPEKYARLVSWVVAEFAHDTVIVIGHSMGGAVGLRYAHLFPEQVSRLVMVDAAGILQRTVFIKHMAKVPVSYERLDPYQKTIPGLDELIQKVAGMADDWTQSLLVTADRMPDFPQMMMTNSLARQYLYKDRGSLNAALGLVYEDFSDAVREVVVPTHIIWGDQDSVAPVRTGTVLASVMSNAELHIIEGVGHVPMTENFDEFMAVLNHSLNEDPEARQSQKRLAVVERSKIVKQEVRCINQDNLFYQGHYGKVRIKNCHGIVLRDVVAESIELIGSDVTLENVSLISDNIGLAAVESVVVASLLSVDAKTGILVDSSYLDLAGADFDIQEKFIDIRKSSQLYFSLSQSRNDEQVMPLHGVSMGTVLQVH